MKHGKTIYIFGLVAFLCIMFLLELSAPKKFIWKPTFSRYDPQPLGCKIFDDLVSVSLRGWAQDDTITPYSVSSKTLYQFLQDSTVTRSILIIAEYVEFTETDTDALFELLNRGSRVVIAAADYNWLAKGLLGIDCKDPFYSFSIGRLREYVGATPRRDTLFWLGDSVYEAAIFRIYPHLFYRSFPTVDSAYTILAENKDMRGIYFNPPEPPYPCAITRKYGDGELTLVSTPLLFTNYGMLDEDNHVYLFRLINRLKGLPVVRTEAYGPVKSDISGSPFGYLLSQPPLQWGLYLTLLIILCFMIFTARRKQRFIPVIPPPVNKTMEFVQLVGTLYFQRKDHTDLVRKKYVYFADTLRRKLYIDIDGGEDDKELARLIAIKTGVRESKIHGLLNSVRPVAEGRRQAGEERAVRLVRNMNEIISHI